MAKLKIGRYASSLTDWVNWAHEQVDQARADKNLSPMQWEKRDSTPTDTGFCLDCLRKGIFISSTYGEGIKLCEQCLAELKREFKRVVNL